VYRPYVPVSRVSYRLPFDPRAAASRAASDVLAPAPPGALAQVWLTDGDGRPWTVRADLLGSTPFSRDFVVEADEEGASRLRFGDGVLGMAPPPGTRFRLDCRTGVGLAGNVGREVVAHLAVPAGDPVAAGRLTAGVLQVLNPLPARGGAAPETVEEVRVRAPQAYQAQRRGVTPADWVALAQALPGVRRAGAVPGWEGAAPQDRVWVQRRQGFPEDPPFLDRVRTELEPFRPAGRDLRVLPPRYVGVQVAVRVHLDARTLRSAADDALHRALGDGPDGVFARTAFTFGESVWLSRVVAAAAAVPGVVCVDPVRFARWEPVPSGPALADELPMAAHEVARMQGDPSTPWNGTLSVELHGGIG
jgi:predicted phage baseplate assembly protein